MKMNRELRMKLGIEAEQVIGRPLEDILTVGSKIFYQTHFYPLIKLQSSVREIYLVFKGKDRQIPALLNVEVTQGEEGVELLCGGMEISRRNQYEKELLDAKKEAEDALIKNAALTKAKNKLLQSQTSLELKYREVKSLKEQQQEVFKLIAHDLQEPLRKAIFMSYYIINTNPELSESVSEKLNKIVSYTTTMSEMLLTLLRFREIEGVKLSYSNVNLNAVIASAAENLKLHEEDHIRINYPEKELDFPGDEKLLKRLFSELLRNSQKDHNEKNDNLIIDISAVTTVKNSYFESDDNYQYKKFLKITYTDNGVGFDPKLDKIIDKSEQFNQVNIGLAYCKQIVERHSGAMEAKSIKGKGVSYTILFPLEPVVETV